MRNGVNVIMLNSKLCKNADCQLKNTVQSKNIAGKPTLLSRIVVGISLVALVAGCTTDPYTHEQKPSKAAIGAVAGAVIGAAVSSKKDRGKGALIGAAALGGGGYYMDRQEQKLKAQLEGTGVSVTRDGDQIRLNMPGNVTFETGRAEIQGSFYNVLASVTQVFKEFSKTQVKISGHTDSVGSDAFNQRLSEQRALSVADYMTSNGIPSARITAFGFGERSPIADNSSPQGRAMNRRVEIEIIPMEQSR